MRLFVVRHGDFGPDGGEARGQALAAGRILQGLIKEDFVALLCSPIWRARETAKIIGEVIGRPAYVSTELACTSDRGLRFLIEEHEEMGISVLILVGHQTLLWLVTNVFRGKQEKEEVDGLFRFGSVVRVDTDNGTFKVMS